MEITLLSTKHQRNFSKDNVSESCSVWNCSYGNSTNTTLFEEDKDEELSIYLGAFSWILVVLYIITFMIGLVGNALVCFAVWRNKNMRTVTNVFLVNLAAADLGVIIICLPPALIADVTNTWFLGGPFCNIHLCLSVGISLKQSNLVNSNSSGD